MANTVQTYGNLTLEQKTFYDRTLLERLLPALVYAQYGQKKTAPKNEGDTMDFRRFGSLAPATTALVEAITPDGSSIGLTHVTATVQQFGDYVTYTDKLDMVGIDPVVTEVQQVLGEEAGNTIDQIVRDIVVAGTTVNYASTAVSRVTVAAGMVINGTEIKKAVRTLRRNNALPYDGTHFIGIIGPDAEYDLMSDTMWQDVSKYSASKQIFDGEIGALFGVRFVRSGNAKKFTGAGAAGIDVFATMIIGKNAYGTVDVAGSSKPETVIKPLGYADPLNRVGAIGWKVLLTAVRLNELSMLRLEHAATA